MLIIMSILSYICFVMYVSIAEPIFYVAKQDLSWPKQIQHKIFWEEYDVKWFKSTNLSKPNWMNPF